MATFIQHLQYFTLPGPGSSPGQSTQPAKPGNNKTNQDWCQPQAEVRRGERNVNIWSRHWAQYVYITPVRGHYWPLSDRCNTTTPHYTTPHHTTHDPNTSLVSAVQGLLPVITSHFPLLIWLICYDWAAFKCVNIFVNWHGGSKVFTPAPDTRWN